MLATILFSRKFVEQSLEKFGVKVLIMLRDLEQDYP